MESMIPQWLQDLETLVSLLGFVLTFIVFRTVSQVRLSFQRRARLPEIVKDLTSYASSLSQALSSSDLVNAKTEIRSAYSLLKQSRRLLSAPYRADVAAIVPRLDVFKKKNGFDREGVEAAWQMYSEMLTAIEILRQAIKTGKWE